MAVTENSIKIVKGGTISGDEKSTGAALVLNTDTYVSYGGSTDLWGLSWTTTDINSSTFGIAYSAKGLETTSHYLKATNFGLSIPSGATINGILAEIEQQAKTGGLGARYAYVDHIRITVYYTPPLWVNQSKNSSTFSSQSKNVSSSANQSKNSSTWTNQPKT